MKNFEQMVLFSVTVLFLGLMVGLLIGRYTNRSTVLMSEHTYATSQAIDDNVSTASAASGKLNINFASAKELAMLPGIGMTYAQRIVDYRSNNGPFLHIDDLTNVDGIGQKRLEAISEYITVGG